MLTAIETKSSTRGAETFRATVLIAACATAAWVAFHHNFQIDVVQASYLLAALFAVSLWYSLDRLAAHLPAGLRQASYGALALCSGTWLVLSFYYHWIGYARLTDGAGKLLIGIAGSALLFSIYRLEPGALAASRRPKTRVLIIGSGARASVAWRELRTRHQSTIEVLGFVDDRPSSTTAPDIAHRMVSTVDALAEYLCEHVVDELVIAAPMRSCYDMVGSAVAIAEKAGIPVSAMSDAIGCTRKTERSSQKTGLFQSITVERHANGLGQTTKRALDMVVASGLIVVTSPLLVAIGLGVKLTSPGPAFFVQSRIGLRRRHFPMFKFRSMEVNAHEKLAALESRNEAAGPLFKLSFDPRTTAFGRFLRKNSLDELPQLFNVLLGHMSLVGPRPMSLRDAGHLSEVGMLKRFSVKPGMTGLWQVKGRSIASLDQWIALDARYVDQWTVGLDLQLLVLTVPAVLRRSGAM